MEYLVKRAQKKDDQAFVQLIEMVKGDLYKVARSYLDSEADIADAIQDTIIVCYEKIDSLKERKYLQIIQLFVESGCKYLGYQMGKHYRQLPESFIMKLTMNHNYWRGRNDEDA